MKKCPRCAERVQSDALVCRYCAHEFPKQPDTKSNGGAWLVAIGLLVVIAAAAGGDEGTENNTAPAPKPAIPGPVEIEILAKRNLEASLKDAGSAQYRKVRARMQMQAICGEVNAHNGFGGYTGYRRFVASAASDGPLFFENDSELAPGEFDKFWSQHC